MRISLSPGMPNTHSYNIQIAGDGSIMRHGFKSRDKIDLNKLTAILLEAQRLNWNRYEINDLSQMAKPFVHDAQVFSLSVWENGRFHSVDDPDLSLDGSLSDFVKMVKEVLEIT